MRRVVDYVLQKSGRALVGSGGLSQLGSYSVQRMRLPEPVISGFAEPTTFEVDLERITTPCAFSYHPQGWHPYRATLAELIREPGLAYGQTSLHRFYDLFRPVTVQEAILEDEPRELDPVGRWPAVLPLFKHLWALTPARVRQILAAPEREKGARQQFGPHPREFGQYQLERAWQAYESVRTRGYHPEQFPDGYLTGYFLVRGGDYRFVVFHGNHRLAAFEALGVRRLVARPHRGHPPVIDADDLEPWIDGRYGVFPPEVARRLFDKLFDERGDGKARNLGLV